MESYDEKYISTITTKKGKYSYTCFSVTIIRNSKKIVDKRFSVNKYSLKDIIKFRNEQLLKYDGNLNELKKNNFNKQKCYLKCQWKKKGILLTEKFKNYDELYDYYDKCNNCELCNMKLDICKKCLDHDHVTGLFRNVVCNSCNRIKAVDNKNNYMGIKYVSKLNVKKKGIETEVYRIQFLRKGLKFFKQIRTDKTTLRDVIEIRNSKLIEIDGNLDSINQ